MWLIALPRVNSLDGIDCSMSWGCFHSKIAEVAFMAGVALIAEVAFMAGVALTDIAFKAEVAIKVWVTSGGISIPFTH